MKKNIYKITILNWEKYNGNIKKGYKKILLSTGFLSDAKIRCLTPVTKLLYLSCLLVAGESTSSQIEVSHESLVYQSGVKSGSLQSQLDLLQSLQLVTYEKINLLYNRIEDNRIESKVIEKKIIPARSKSTSKTDTDLNKKIWESYRDAYAHRWKVDPVRNASVNAKISQLGKRLGSEAVQVVDFFLKNNDQFYLKKRHDIGLCLSDAESLRTQMLSSVSASPQTKAQQTMDHIKDQYQRVMKGEL